MSTIFRIDLTLFEESICGQVVQYMYDIYTNFFFYRDFIDYHFQDQLSRHHLLLPEYFLYYLSNLPLIEQWYKLRIVSYNDHILCIFSQCIMKNSDQICICRQLFDYFYTFLIFLHAITYCAKPIIAYLCILDFL